MTMTELKTIKPAAMVLLTAIAILLPVARASASESEILARAIDEAIAKVRSEIDATAFKKVTKVAVVPLRGDADDYATSSLKSAVTKTHYSLYTRSDDTWDTLLAEIEWGVKREDVMAEKTVQKFGRIAGVQAILYGRMWDRETNMWSLRGRVKMSVHLAEVETGQILWSSGPVQAEAYIHWSDAITRFWQYPVLLIGVIVGLIIVLIILRKILKAITHASRPL